MSQEKVDRYKESKKHRKEEVRKAKRNKIIARVVGVLVAIAVVCWIAYSGYSIYQRNQPVKKTAVNLTAAEDYLQGLDGDTTEQQQ